MKEGIALLFLCSRLLWAFLIRVSLCLGAFGCPISETISALMFLIKLFCRAPTLPVHAVPIWNEIYRWITFSFAGVLSEFTPILVPPVVISNLPVKKLA